MLKGQIPIVSIYSKIKAVLGKYTDKIGLGFWKLASSFKGNMNKSKAFFVQGLKIDNQITYDKQKVTKIVAKYYMEKFREERSETVRNLQRIEQLQQRY